MGANFYIFGILIALVLTCLAVRLWWVKPKKHWVRIENTSDWEQTKVIPVTLLTRNGGLWEEKETWQRVDRLDGLN